MTPWFRVVLDTNVIVQATLRPLGPMQPILAALDAGTIEMYISYRLRQEYEMALTREDVRARYPHLTDNRMEAVLAHLDAKAVMVGLPNRYVEYLRDPKDEPVLNLAIEVQADYIIAHDKDLLDLNHNHDFRLLYPFLRIVDPVTFITLLARTAEQNP